MRTPLLFLVLLALLIFGSADAAQQARLTLPAVPHYELPALPLIATIKPPLYTEPYARENKSENNSRKPEYWYEKLWQWFVTTYYITANEPITLFTFVLAVSTIGLWIVTICASRRQSHDMRKSISVAERALESVERAFVFVRGFAQLPQLGSDGRMREWAIMPILHNSGSTPTRHMLAHANIEIRDDELPDDFAFPDKWGPNESHENSLTFVGPKADLWMGALGMHVVDLSKINIGQKKIYIYGWVEYDDIFPNTRRHRTEWCSEVSRVGEYTNPIGAPVGLRHYKKYNGADDECFREPAPYAFFAQTRPISS